jgi:hypothetical protein
MVDGAEVSVNSKPATLVDLSLVGAQILTSSRLTPTQGVRFTFEDQGKMVRIRATVVWASFEATSGTPCYRAAIEFLDVDEEPLQRLIDSKRKTRISSRK